jgi:trans-aconitate 2-methyltransferase
MSWFALLSFFHCVILFAELPAEDHWKGDEYAKNSESQRNTAEEFIQKVTLQGREAILDVGCGDGKITAKMAQMVPNGYVVGVDISASMIERAKKSFSDRKNLMFQISDAQQLPFLQQFDIITSFTVLQFVLEQKEALQNFKKALKPGGKLWIQMPTGLTKTMQTALDKMLAQEKWASYLTDFSPPWRFYDVGEYRSLLLSLRFIPTRIEIVKKYQDFPSRSAFEGFLKQIFPYLRPLPEEEKDLFIAEYVDHYLEDLPLDDQGKVKFLLECLEVEAKK